MMRRSEGTIDAARTVDAILEAAGIERQEHRERFFWESGDLQVTGTERPAGPRETERGEARRSEEGEPKSGQRRS